LIYFVSFNSSNRHTSNDSPTLPNEIAAGVINIHHLSESETTRKLN